MDDQAKGIEHRMVHRLLVHWRDARGEGAFPSLDGVLGRDLGDIEPSIFVLRVPAGAGEPVFERLGDAFAGEAPGGLAGRPVSEIPEGTLLAHAVRDYGTVLARKVPVSRDGEFTDARGDRVLYRSVMLPVGGDGGVIGFLLGAANAKTKGEDA